MVYIEIERGGQKVKISKTKVSGCCYTLFCISRCVDWFVSSGIERLEKPSACILVLDDCIHRHLPLRPKLILT